MPSRLDARFPVEVAEAAAPGGSGQAKEGLKVTEDVPSVAGASILGRPLAHVGYVVESIPQAVELWQRNFGVGPFFTLGEVEFDEISSADGPFVWDHSAAFAQWGGVGLELQQIARIEPADVLGPRFAEPNRLNHVAYAVDDLEAERARLDRLGFERLAGLTSGPDTMVMYDVPHLGHALEVHQDFELFKRFRSELVTSARDWDGSNALRPVSAEIRESFDRLRAQASKSKIRS